jgi:hypothetical protein
VDFFLLGGLLFDCIFELLDADTHSILVACIRVDRPANFITTVPVRPCGLCTP